MPAGPRRFCGDRRSNSLAACSLREPGASLRSAPARPPCAGTSSQPSRPSWPPARRPGGPWRRSCPSSSRRPRTWALPRPPWSARCRSGKPPWRARPPVWMPPRWADCRRPDSVCAQPVSAHTVCACWRSLGGKSCFVPPFACLADRQADFCSDTQPTVRLGRAAPDPCQVTVGLLSDGRAVLAGAAAEDSGAAGGAGGDAGGGGRRRLPRHRAGRAAVHPYSIPAGAPAAPTASAVACAPASGTCIGDYCASPESSNEDPIPFHASVFFTA